MGKNDIHWQKNLDSDDNTFWEGDSPYVEGVDGPHFKWRLKQKLQGNRIVWYTAHDSVLGTTCEPCETLEAAKAACQVAHNTIVEEPF